MVIPLHDQNPTMRRAWVTLGLVLLTIGCFLLEPLRSSATGADGGRAACEAQAFFARWAAIPAELTSNEQSREVFLGPVAEGCLYGPPSYNKPPVLSVLSAMFLHSGWLHLLGNLLFLWVFGNNVEDRFGRLRFLLFYLFCGYAATYGYAFAFPSAGTPLIGASGAIAGVLGAYVVLYPRARVLALVTIIPIRLPAWIVLGSWFALQWLYSSGTLAADTGVAYVAHVFGFVTGLVIGLVARSFPSGGRARRGDAWDPRSGLDPQATRRPQGWR